MKLVRYGPPGREKPGLVDAEGHIRDLSRVVKDITPATLSPAPWRQLKKLNVARLPRVKGKPRLGAPIGGVGNLIGVGLNYADHAKETGAALPPEPLLFSKAVTSICGPNDTVRLPRGSQKSDWEVELAIVIGRVTRYVSEAAALNYVAGYCICNDVSEREWQFERAGQFVKGKSADTFAPLGPWLVSRDEIPDPQNLRLWLDLNGERTQNGTTANMIAGCARLVSYISQFMTLMPGDVISTGTPPGVGHGRKPPRYLRPGDVMRLGVQGLGEQRQKVAAPAR